MTDACRSILEDYSMIAVVGLSTDPGKAAHSVPAAMQGAGFRVVPVHPTAAEILGERAYPTLTDIPEPVELVNIFRPSAEAPDIARQAVEIGARAMWLQLGLRSAQARQIAEDAGLRYVEDRCIAIERTRYGVSKGLGQPT
jgi:predicted CoA-binding protein